MLEAVARKRAIVGSDTLLIFLLKAVRPEKFRDRYQVQHVAKVDPIERGDPFEILRDPDVKKALDDFHARRAGIRQLPSPGGSSN